MNPKILATILCVIFATAAFFAANHLVIGMSLTFVSTVVIGAFFGVVSAYPLLFNKPATWSSLLKPAALLAVLAFVAITFTSPGADTGKLLSALLSMSLVGVAGGLGFHLGLYLKS